LFIIPSLNGQVSRLGRPNEWVKYKKFQQKFGEFESAQVRGFLSSCLRPILLSTSFSSVLIVFYCTRPVRLSSSYSSCPRRIPLSQHILLSSSDRPVLLLSFFPHPILLYSSNSSDPVLFSCSSILLNNFCSLVLVLFSFFSFYIRKPTSYVDV
jgi:hypothetical protein